MSWEGKSFHGPTFADPIDAIAYAIRLARRVEGELEEPVGRGLTVDSESPLSNYALSDQEIIDRG